MLKLPPNHSFLYHQSTLRTSRTRIQVQHFSNDFCARTTKHIIIHCCYHYFYLFSTSSSPDKIEEFIIKYQPSISTFLKDYQYNYKFSYRHNRIMFNFIFILQHNPLAPPFQKNYKFQDSILNKIENTRHGVSYYHFLNSVDYYKTTSIMIQLPSI